MELSLKDLRELISGTSNRGCETPLETGKSYFIRTLTYHLIGRVTGIRGTFICLEDACWVADSGRFHDAIANGNLEEVEPVDTAFVNITNVSDAFPWNHPLPREQK